MSTVHRCKQSQVLGSGGLTAVDLGSVRKRADPYPAN